MHADSSSPTDPDGHSFLRTNVGLIYLAAVIAGLRQMPEFKERSGG